METLPRNRNLQISRAPTKAKSREPAYSQALNQNKIIRHSLHGLDLTRDCTGDCGLYMTLNKAFTWPWMWLLHDHDCGLYMALPTQGTMAYTWPWLWPLHGLDLGLSTMTLKWPWPYPHLSDRHLAEKATAARLREIDEPLTDRAIWFHLFDLIDQLHLLLHYDLCL